MQKCVGHAIEAGFLSPLPLPIGYFKRQLKGKVSALKVIWYINYPYAENVKSTNRLLSSRVYQYLDEFLCWLRIRRMQRDQKAC